MKWLKNFASTLIKNKLFLFCCWVVVTLFVWSQLQQYFGLPAIPWPFVFPVGVGFFLIFHRPIEERWARSELLEQGLAFVCFMIFLTYFLMVTIVPKIREEGDVSVPCSPGSVQLRCYSLPQEACEDAWFSFEKECSAEIKGSELVQKNPTALIGPALKRCVQRRFDKHLYYTRNASTAECADYFEKLGD